jgi:hypothetical protein
MEFAYEKQNVLLRPADWQRKKNKMETKKQSVEKEMSESHKRQAAALRRFLIKKKSPLIKPTKEELEKYFN